MKRVIGYWFLSLLLVFLAACQIDAPNNNVQGSVRANVQASVTEGVTPLAVTFDASRSQGNVATFSWVFGDGAEGQGERASHTFTRAGVFNVRLTVADSNGNEDSKTVTVRVQDAGGNPNPNPNPKIVPVSAGVALALRRAEIEGSFSNLGVDGVYFATRQSGNTELIVTGTVTQNSNGQFSYSPAPSDRLRVVFNDGFTLEYTFTALEGDFSQPDGERFLRKDHRVSYQLVSSDGSDVQVSLSRINGDYQNTVNGTVVDDGVSYEIDTQTQGSVLSDFGPGSVRFESEEQTTGTITSAGFSATIDETFSYKLVLVTQAAEDIRHTFNNTWTIGTDTFELANATVFRVFSDGRPIELDSWLASGVLVRNGQNIGGLSQEQTVTSVDTVLTADGEKTVLFSDRSF